MPMPLRNRALLLAASLAALALPSTPASAARRAPRTATQQAAPTAQPVPRAPRLLVAIAVDQFSADLFAQYRSHFTGGLARLASGAVFPAGYQSHAATETCPGHSTILTGMHPARTGVIANTWIDQSVSRAKKTVYCAEDETRTPGDPKDYVASAAHLLVPTLGERMKARWPASRTVAVAGKDRAALMMGGHAIDQAWWWKSAGFATRDGVAQAPAAEAENAAVGQLLATGALAMALPAGCAVHDHAIALTAGSGPNGLGSLAAGIAGADAGTGFTVGTGRFALAKGDTAAFRASPRLDAAVLDLALRLVADQNLGAGSAPDMLAIGLSATDYIGHAYGTQGAEMCIQLHALDKALGAFFAALDRRGLDYAVVLTADHGGQDLPERLDQQALPQAGRASPALLPEAVSTAIASRLGLEPKGLILSDGAAGDYWIRRDLPANDKARVLDAAKAELLANPQVAAVFTAAELAAAPVPSGSPETWTLLERARGSFYAPRSGDFVVLLKPAVTAIVRPAPGIVATHGSPWDYDRRVPILFWRKGMSGFEQPHPVETVDIAPSLAALIGLDVPAGTFDGRCLDLDAGPGTTCGAKP